MKISERITSTILFVCIMLGVVSVGVFASADEAEQHKTPILSWETAMSDSANIAKDDFKTNTGTAVSLSCTQDYYNPVKSVSMNYSGQTIGYNSLDLTSKIDHPTIGHFDGICFYIKVGGANTAGLTFNITGLNISGVEHGPYPKTLTLTNGENTFVYLPWSEFEIDNTDYGTINKEELSVAVQAKNDLKFLINVYTYQGGSSVIDLEISDIYGYMTNGKTNSEDYDFFIPHDSTVKNLPENMIGGYAGDEVIEPEKVMVDWTDESMIDIHGNDSFVSDTGINAVANTDYYTPIGSVSFDYKETVKSNFFYEYDYMSDVKRETWEAFAEYDGICFFADIGKDNQFSAELRIKMPSGLQEEYRYTLTGYGKNKFYYIPWKEFKKFSGLTTSLTKDDFKKLLLSTDIAGRIYIHLMVWSDSDTEIKTLDLTISNLYGIKESKSRWGYTFDIPHSRDVKNIPSEFGTVFPFEKSTNPTTQAPTTVAQTPTTVTQTPTAVTQTPTKVKPKALAKIKGVTTKAGKRKVTIKWKKAKNAKKYVVKYSYKKNMKGAKTRTVKKTKVVLKKLKSGKKLYVRIQGVNGKLKGKLSARKSIKIK